MCAHGWDAMEMYYAAYIGLRDSHVKQRTHKTCSTTNRLGLIHPENGRK
ncbi:hypothetical protein NSMM_150009 [Nitrosomonas mobilis]|uniref:Uncharacterized protein n=1 Tax=Nitrosomonas mobilis TaxID=51642 RepID=A0A1G5SCK0_9PROT|nr:hypothetical protein NSMM_150009 [Nitrosomonas mobilis]